jgi:putative glycosyltransferase (TIGR04348 family)
VKIEIVTPQEPGAVIGNVITAERYARIFRQLGHRVVVSQSGGGDAGADLLVALHARRSFAAIQRFTSQRPGAPVVVVLTGTDLYRDIHHDAQAQDSLDLATRLVVLQAMGRAELPERLLAKTWVIYQSAPMLRARVARPRTSFRVCVVGHLRPEKDPFRTAHAARQLPESSRVRVLHIGAALDPGYERQARQEAAMNPRYRWIGEQPHGKTRRTVAGSHLLAITSLMEGSSNILCEALAQPAPTPVVASRISGLIGTLGEDYPGYFPVEDTGALADLLWRAESDADFYRSLADRCAHAAPLVMPERERACWAELLDDLGSTRPGGEAISAPA